MNIEITQTEVIIEVNGAVDDLNMAPGMEMYGQVSLLLRQNDTIGKEELLTPGEKIIAVFTMIQLDQ